MFDYDAIVIGLGGMGSAALYQLARRGVRALGIEQFEIAHNRGSSHGVTRLIRRAYFEHPDYVPLVNRAYELWTELEQRSGKKLFHRTGLALFGPRDGAILPNVKRAAAEHHLDIETLPLEDAAKRFTMFRLEATGLVRNRGWPVRQWALNPDWECLYEADAGYLLVEESVRTFVEQAVSLGATVRTGETMLGWRTIRDGIRLSTDARRYTARRLIVCGGAWTGRLLEELGLPLTIRRKVVQWFPTTNEAFRADQGCPVFGFDIPEGSADLPPDPALEQAHAVGISVQPIPAPEGFFYGFPVIDADGVKLSNHRGGAVVASPDLLELRGDHVADEMPLREFSRLFLGESGDPVRRSVCMYTMTPDEHFIVDHHPRREQVVFAAGFSGHGFKFAPVIGSVLADLAMDGQTQAPISFLRLNRPTLHSR